MLYKILPVSRRTLSGCILFICAKIIYINESMVADFDCKNKNLEIFEL